MTEISRRKLFAGTTAIAGLAAFGSTAKAQVVASDDPFEYEVQRTEEEWRALLGDAYPILREGKTEPQRSSRLWANAQEGTYSCLGCDLLQYRSFAKINLAKGWAFFVGSEPNSQMMSQDYNFAGMPGEAGTSNFAIETHCRRCGSHMGHILLVEGMTLHCINGSALSFTPAAA